MKENVQIIAWTVEILAFLTAIAVGRFVWCLGKRKSRENEHDKKNHQTISCSTSRKRNSRRQERPGFWAAYPARSAAYSKIKWCLTHGLIRPPVPRRRRGAAGYLPRISNTGTCEI